MEMKFKKRFQKLEVFAKISSLKSQTNLKFYERLLAPNMWKVETQF